MSATTLQEKTAAKPSRFSSRYIKAKAFESYLRMVVRPPQALSAIPGYLHPLEARFLYWLAAKVPANGLALEVGSYKGKSSAHLAAGLTPTARLACVDTWQNDAMPYDPATDVLPEFLENIGEYRSLIKTHRGRSAEVAADWSQPIDLLFIDGDHSYEGCSTDLQAWLSHVRPGGWIAFHDSSEAGVERAIAELFPPSQRTSDLRAWSILAAMKR